MLRQHFQEIRFSHVYRSAARDEEDQDDFLNAVAQADTKLSPTEVYDVLAHIEQTLHKNPPYPKGPRTIDLDILLYGNTKFKIQNSKFNLLIPHPRMHERRFVLEPLCELHEDPQWKNYLQKTLDQDCQKTVISL